MNQAFQATVVETVSSRPMKPVTLDIDENLIRNLLIISKPREIEEQQTKERYAIIANALDLDFLEFEELDVDYLEFEDLDVDYLAQDDLEFNELDINYLRIENSFPITWMHVRRHSEFLIHR